MPISCVQWIFYFHLGCDLLLLGFKLYTQFSAAFGNICFSLRLTVLIISYDYANSLVFLGMRIKLGTEPNEDVFDHGL